MKKYIGIPKVYIILILAAAIIVFIGQKFVGSSNNNSATNQQSTVEIVKKGDITSSISASGTVLTANFLAITTSVNGIVKQVFVKEGDKVIKGQKIMTVTLDSDGEQGLANAYSAYIKAKASLASAQNTLYSLKSNLIQAEDVFKKIKESAGYSTHDERVAFDTASNDYLKAKGDYDNQQNQIITAQIALGSALLGYQAQSPTVISPSDGVISNIVAIEGTKIENSVTTDRSVKTVASIIKEGTPIVSLNVNELDINKVSVGQKVNMNLSSNPDKVFIGTVVGIDKIGATQSGVSNYPVIVKFDDPSDLVLPNMSVTAEIILDKKQSILIVPIAAVTDDSGKKFITKDNGQTVEVTTGISDGSNIEIVSGLNEGDNVVLSAYPTSGFTSTQNTNQSRGTGIGGLGLIRGR